MSIFKKQHIDYAVTDYIIYTSIDYYHSLGGTVARRSLAAGAWMEIA